MPAFPPRPQSRSPAPVRAWRTLPDPTAIRGMRPVRPAVGGRTMTFNEWLAKRKVTLTPRGDLITYLRSIPIEMGSIYELLGHLVRERPSPDAAKAARARWRQYARETGRPVW